MLTKGIIKQIDFKGNTCVVRIPIFETAQSSEFIVTATIATQPGIYNGYKEDDIVYVGFETDTYEEPVIIGKLFLGTEKEGKEPRGTINTESFAASSTAKIPFDTKLANNVDPNIPNTQVNYTSIQKMTNMLDSTKNLLDKTNNDFGNQINQIISGQSELGEELTTAIRQTKKSIVLEAQRAEEAEAKLTVEADRISAEVSGKLDTESGRESFGWDLTQNSWRVFASGTVKEDEITTAKIANIVVTENDKNVTKSYVIVNGVRCLELNETNKTSLGITDLNTAELKAICYMKDNKPFWKIYNVADSTKYISTTVPANTKSVLTATNEGLVVNGSGTFNGNGTFAGTITATDGHIGKFSIGNEHTCDKTKKQESGIYSENYIEKFEDDPKTENKQGVYVGTDGIKLGTNFSVDIDGKVIASDIALSGAAKREFAGVTGNLQDGNRNGINNTMLVTPTDLSYVKDGETIKSNGPLSLTKIKTAISKEINLTKENIAKYFVNQCFVLTNYKASTPGICKYLKMQDVKDKLLPSTKYTYSFKARIRKNTVLILNPNIYCALIATKTDDNLEIIGGQLDKPTLWRSSGDGSPAISTTWTTGTFTFTTTDTFNSGDYKSINLFIIVASYGQVGFSSGVELVDINQIKLETGDTYTDFTYSALDQLGSFNGIALSITRNMTAAEWEALTKGSGVQDKLAGSSGDVGKLEQDATYLLTGVAADTQDTYTVFCKCANIITNEDESETVEGIVLSNTCQKKGEAGADGDEVSAILINLYYSSISSNSPTPPTITDNKITLGDWKREVQYPSNTEPYVYICTYVETKVNGVHTKDSDISDVKLFNSKDGLVDILVDKNNGIGLITYSDNDKKYYLKADTISGAMGSDVRIGSESATGDNNGFTIQSANEKSKTPAAIYNTINSFDSATTKNGIYIGTDGIRLGSTFSVDSTGKIKSTGGTIGGFTINETSLEAGTSDTDNYVKLGIDEIKLGTNFSVDSTGTIYANNGKIGPYTIDHFTTSSFPEKWRNNLLAYNLTSKKNDRSFLAPTGFMSADRAIFADVSTDMTEKAITTFFPLLEPGNPLSYVIAPDFAGQGYIIKEPIHVGSLDFRDVTQPPSGTNNKVACWDFSVFQCRASIQMTVTITFNKQVNNAQRFFAGFKVIDVDDPLRPYTNSDIIELLENANLNDYSKWDSFVGRGKFIDYYYYKANSSSDSQGIEYGKYSTDTITHSVNISATPGQVIIFGFAADSVAKKNLSVSIPMVFTNSFETVNFNNIFKISGSDVSQYENLKCTIKNADITGYLTEISDLSTKENIIELSSNKTFDTIFDSLRPVSFKYKQDITWTNPNKTHVGFIAQDVQRAIQTAQLNDKEVAMISYDEFNNKLGLSYLEFIALNTGQIQKLKKRVAELEEKLNKLEKGE